MKKTKTFTYKEIEVVVDVELNSVKPEPPAHHDTAPRHFINVHIDEYGFVYPVEVSDLHLSGEIDKAEKAARDFIDEKTRTMVEPKDIKKGHADKLKAKGFK